MFYITMLYFSFMSHLPRNTMKDLKYTIFLIKNSNDPDHSPSKPSICIFHSCRWLRFIELSIIFHVENICKMNIHFWKASVLLMWSQNYMNFLIGVMIYSSSHSLTFLVLVEMCSWSCNGAFCALECVWWNWGLNMKCNIQRSQLNWHCNDLSMECAVFNLVDWIKCLVKIGSRG